MAANNILAFAQGLGANVLDQPTYLGDAQRPLGNQPGTARAAFVNKCLLQLSAIAAGAGQFLADMQGADVGDGLLAAAYSTMWQDAILATAGGRYAGIVGISGSTVFPASYFGKHVVSGAAGGLAHTLPAFGAGDAGKMITVTNTGTAACTLAAAGAQLLTTNGTTYGSLSLASGDWAVFVVPAAGTAWIVFGSAAAKYSGSWLLSNSSPGYQKFPSGAVLQWGSGLYGAATSVSFPLAFPTQCWQVVMGPSNYDSPAAAWQKVAAIAAYSWNNANFSASSTTGAALGGSWLAFGN